jgi:hypothetical protein
MLIFYTAARPSQNKLPIFLLKSLDGRKYSHNPLLQQRMERSIGKSPSGIGVFQSGLTEVFSGLQECIYDLWVKAEKIWSGALRITNF